MSIGIAELMARAAQVQAPEIMPIRASEPISLNAAYQIRDVLIKEHLTTVIVITPGFRGKRSSLICQAALARAGITVYCVPGFVGATREGWTRSWHGIQEVSNQFFKLQFYRFYVLLSERKTLMKFEASSPAVTGRPSRAVREHPEGEVRSQP